MFLVDKSALDGGHSEKRYAGYSNDSKQFDAKVHHKYIYEGLHTGGH